MDTRRFRPHQVLGDAAQYQQALEQQQAARESQGAENGSLKESTGSHVSSSAGLATLDPAVVDSIPADVWAAAQLLGDQKGMRLVSLYNELAAHR
jgi:hypothetical protein